MLAVSRPSACSAAMLGARSRCTFTSVILLPLTEAYRRPSLTSVAACMRLRLPALKPCCRRKRHSGSSSAASPAGPSSAPPPFAAASTGGSRCPAGLCCQALRLWLTLHMPPSRRLGSAAAAALRLLPSGHTGAVLLWWQYEDKLGQSMHRIRCFALSHSTHAGCALHLHRSPTHLPAAQHGSRCGSACKFSSRLPPVAVGWSAAALQWRKCRRSQSGRTLSEGRRRRGRSGGGGGSGGGGSGMSGGPPAAHYSPAQAALTRCDGSGRRKR